MSSNLLLLTSATLSFTLLGLIITVQFVHHPAFGDVGASPHLVADLLRANWVRTAAWAGRSALLAVFVARLVR